LAVSQNNKIEEGKIQIEIRKCIVHVTLLVWNGFPVLIIGGSDAKRRFFAIAIAVCSAEKNFELPPIVTSPAYIGN